MHLLCFWRTSLSGEGFVGVLPAVTPRQQVLKLLINYTHRWFARFFLGVMDTTECNTRTGNKYVPTYVHIELLGWIHARMPLRVRARVSRVLTTCCFMSVCGCFLPSHIRQCQVYIRRGARMASWCVACVPMLFFESSLACTVSFLRSLCFIVFLWLYKNERCRRYCSLGFCLVHRHSVPNDFLESVPLHYNGIIKCCNWLRFLPC